MSQLARVRGDGQWEKPPSSSAQQSGTAGSRGKSGDFQRTKRLLAASVDGSGEGESPAPAPAGVREKHKKAPGVCVLSPWQPRLHHRHGSQGRPGQNTLLWEMESSGQAQQHPRYMGVTFGECHSRDPGQSR